MAQYWRSLVVFLLTFHISQPLIAQALVALPSMKFADKYFQMTGPGSSSQGHKVILQELLGSETPGFNWPAFPRTFSKVSEWKAQETTTSLGLDVNAIAASLGLGPLTTVAQVGASIKRNFKYSYNFNISLIVMSSYEGSINDGDIFEGSLEQITRIDPATERVFFKSSDAKPMVGFCSIEASLDIIRSKEFGIRYIVGTTNFEAKEGRSYSHALFTKFFQIEPDVPMSHYLKVYCRDEFSMYARPVVEADFNNMVIEESIHGNPLNRCKMDDSNGEFGDESCGYWQVKNFSQATRQRTVARCNIRDNDVSRCELRAKKGKSCGLWIDDDGQYTEQYKKYRDATVPGFSQPCDAGLTCKMQKSPLRLRNLVIWPGYATCQ